MPSDALTVLAGDPVQRTFMALGGASAWVQLLTAVFVWLPVAALGIAAGAFLVVRRHSSALPVAAFGLSLAAGLLAVARIVARPLYIRAVLPGMLPPWVFDALTGALRAAFDATLAAGSIVVVVALLVRAPAGIRSR